MFAIQNGQGKFFKLDRSQFSMMTCRWVEADKNPQAYQKAEKAQTAADRFAADCQNNVGFGLTRDLLPLTVVVHPKTAAIDAAQRPATVRCPKQEPHLSQAELVDQADGLIELAHATLAVVQNDEIGAKYSTVFLTIRALAKSGALDIEPGQYEKLRALDQQN